jgi:putative ABC transport system ATP-binding protein
MAVLEASDLRKEYIMGEHKVEALKGVDFSAAKGEFLAVMGSSGSGKSTLLHLLGGLEKPSHGEVILDGQYLSRLSDDQVTVLRRRKVGFVFQFFHLLPTMSAEENIALPLIIDGQDPRRYRERLDMLLALIGLADRRHHRPDQLSGGEQQRVALARALLTDPAIVLADEPTGNLDTRTSATIMGLLRRSCDEFSQTVVAVTHDPRAAAYADQVVILQDGRIVARTTLPREESLATRHRVVLEQIERLEL